MDNTKKQALLITAQTEFAKIIKTILMNNTIEINTRYEALASPAVIRKAYQSTGNTVFVRKAFSRFVAEQGAPFLIIIDYRIFLTSDLRQDPDMQKILKTLLISYILLNYESKTPVQANFVLIDVGEKGSGATEAERNPALLLDIISTENAEINAMIHAYKKNPQKFNSTFRFLALSPKSEYNEIKVKFDAFLARIAEKPQSEEKENQKTAVAAKPQNKFSGECTTVFKKGASYAIINGLEASMESPREYSQLPDNQIHVVGHWGKDNFQEIAKKIMHTLETAFIKGLFDESGEIIINLSRNCTFEPSVMGFLVTLVNGELGRGKKIKIFVDFKNSLVLEKAQGFRLISKNVFHCF